MKKIHLTTIIHSSVQKVWDTTIGKDTYPVWTEIFYPGSNIEGSWEKGAKVFFLAPNEQGTKEGMVSVIEECKKPEFISIKHLGFLKNGKEDTTSEEVKQWAGSYENYTFTKIDESTTEFAVDMGVPEIMEPYFLEVWPKGLKNLKELAETGKISTISTITWIHAPIEKVWEYYTVPEHITKWAFASDDWEAPYAENDLKVGGRFKTTMAAKNKSEQFDFTGVYTNVKTNELIEYKMDDGRMATVTFNPTQNESVQVVVTFDMEDENPRQKQYDGWQSILNNFKKHVENN